MNTHNNNEIEKLHIACRDWGLFQLVNHGISNECIKEMRDEIERFFELPLKEKMRWAQRAGSLEGYGQAFVTSQDQKLDWNDMLFLKSLPIQNRNLDFWPQNPPHFSETLEKYAEAMRETASSTMKFIIMALGVEAPKVIESLEEGQYDIRMNCYPPCANPQRVLGLTAHEDMNAITLLLQCGHVSGLQLIKDGKWASVEPIEGAIVVNIGQMVEVMSNGIYKAPLHRAVVNKMEQRLSIATFCLPSSSVQIGPFEKLIGEGNPPLYKTMTKAEYFDKFFNRKLEESFIDSLKI